MADEPTLPLAGAGTAAPDPAPAVTADPPSQVGAVGEGPEVRSGTALPEPPAQPTPEAAPAPEAPAAAEPEVKPEEPSAPKPSLLSEAAAEAEKADAEKPAEPEAAAPAQYGPFKFPEGFQASEERIAPFMEFLGEARLSQEHAQRLVDLHASEVQRLAQEMSERQHAVFDETRANWRAEFEKDPEIGGNRRQTTINSVVGLIRHYATDADHLRRTLSVLDFTGAGDHPDVIRLLANAAKGLQQQYREGAPVGAGQPAPTPQSRYRNRYRATNGSAVQ